MKRVIRLFLGTVCILALLAGFFTAYAIDAGGNGTNATPDDPAYFYTCQLDASYGGDHDYGVSRTKVRPDSFARFLITTQLTNTTGHAFYVNLRTPDLNTIVGTPHTVPLTASAPYNFNVVYTPSYGSVGASYRSSMQSYSFSTSGYVSIKGTWAP